MGEFKRKDNDDIVALAFSPDSKLVAAGTRGGLIRLYDVLNDSEVLDLDDVPDEIFSIAFHPNGRFVAATGKDKRIRFWNLRDKKLVSTTKLPKLEFRLRLQFSSDGQQLATGTSTGESMTLWKVEVRK